MITCTADRPGGSGHTTARAAGVLHATDVAGFELALTTHLRRGRAVLLDVAELRLPHPAGAASFSRALLAAGGWPTARLVLVGADGRLTSALRRTRAGQDVLVADDVEQARARLADRPDRVSRTLRLPAAAGAFVEAAGRDWDVPTLAERARPVAVHLTREVPVPGKLTVSLDRAGLRIALRTFRSHCAPDERLRPLRRLGHDCGTIGRSDGTVVWALVAGP